MLGFKFDEGGKKGDEKIIIKVVGVVVVIGIVWGVYKIFSKSDYFFVNIEIGIKRDVVNVYGSIKVNC